LTSISDNTVCQLKVKIEDAGEIWTFGVDSHIGAAALAEKAGKAGKGGSGGS
jgi:hypothetical protein